MISNRFYQFLPLITLMITPFFVAYYYEERLVSSIYKTDFYFIWIAGFFCWIYNIYFNPPRCTSYVTKICTLACVYAFFNYLLKAKGDENSIYALITLIFCLGIIHYLRSISIFKRYLILASIIFIFCIQIFEGISQAIKNHEDSLAIKGSLCNSGFLANYLSALIPLFLSGLINIRVKWLRILFGGVFILAVILLSLTFARAAFIGSALGCFFVIFIPLKKIRNKKKLFIFGVGILILPALTVLLFNLKPESAIGRLTIYRVSTNIINDNPFIGIGPNRFSAVYNNYQSDYFKPEQSSISRQLIADNTFEAFNSIVQIIVEYGFIGFALLMLLIWQLVKDWSYEREKDKNWLKIGSIGCVISILMASLFSNPFHVTPILFAFVYHLAIVFSRTENLNLNIAPTKISLLMITMTFCMFILYFGIKHHYAESAWDKASKSAMYDGFASANKYYKKAYPALKFSGEFLFNYGAEACLAKNYTLAIQLLEESKEYYSCSNLYVYLGDAYTGVEQFSLAEENYLKAIYMAPSHIYPKYQLIKLYRKWGRQEDAKLWALRTMQYPVKIKTSLANNIISELKKDFQ
jgi:O-antigen polymerase